MDSYDINNISVALDYAKNIEFDDFSYEKMDCIKFTDKVICKSFTYLISQDVFVNLINIEFKNLKPDSNVIDYLNIIINVCKNVVQLKIRPKIICNINMLVYAIIDIINEIQTRVDIKEILKLLDLEIYNKLNEIKTLILLNHDSVQNIFAFCNYFFDKIRNHENVKFNFCIIFMIYFGVLGYTPENILVNKNITNEYIPVFVSKLTN